MQIPSTHDNTRIKASDWFNATQLSSLSCNLIDHVFHWLFGFSVFLSKSKVRFRQKRKICVAGKRQSIPVSFDSNMFHTSGLIQTWNQIYIAFLSVLFNWKSRPRFVFKAVFFWWLEKDKSNTITVIQTCFFIINTWIIAGMQYEVDKY